MKKSLSRFGFLGCLILSATACSPSPAKPNSSSSSVPPTKSELFLHIDELQQNIERTPSMSDAMVSPSKRAKRLAKPRLEAAREEDDTITHLKSMREKIIRGVYMLDTWINDSIEQEELPPNMEKKACKRISFDRVLDQAILEYVDFEKDGVEGDWSGAVVTYTSLKSSYDMNDKMVISGYEVETTHNERGGSVFDDSYTQRSFDYLEDNYLACLTESWTKFYYDDHFEHLITLALVDLKPLTPIYKTFSYTEAGFLRDEAIDLQSLTTEVYQDGAISFAQKYEGHRTSQGDMSFGLGPRGTLYLYDQGNRVGEVMLPNEEMNEYDFILDLSALQGYQSYVETATSKTLTFVDGRHVGIKNIREERIDEWNSSYTYDSENLRLEESEYSATIGLRIDDELTIDLAPSESASSSAFALVENVLNNLQIEFRSDAVFTQLSVIENIDAALEPYSFFGGKCTDFITFDEAYAIFHKYEDPDMITQEEALNLDLSGAIDEDQQTADGSGYSIFCDPAEGTAAFDPSTRTFNLANVQVNLLANPLMRNGDRYSLVAGLKNEKGTIDYVLDSSAVTYEGENARIHLNRDIPLPDLSIGSYYLVCYLTDPSGNRISAFYYPAYEAEYYIENNADGDVLVVENMNGVHISVQSAFFKDASIKIEAEVKSEVIGDQYISYLQVGIKGPRVSLSSSYIKEGTKAALSLYMVNAEGEKTMIVHRGSFYGETSALECSFDQLFLLPLDGHLSTEMTPFPAGEYSLAAEFVVGEADPLVIENSIFDCSYTHPEDYGEDVGIALNDSQNNFVITIQ